MSQTEHRQQHRSRKARQYICQDCLESFTRSEHLRRHQMAHRNEKPYACPCCPLTSTRKDVISRHVNKFHPNMSREMRSNSQNGDAATTRNAAQQQRLPVTGPSEASTPTARLDESAMPGVVYDEMLLQPKANQPLPPSNLINTPPGTCSDFSYSDNTHPHPSDTDRALEDLRPPGTGVLTPISFPNSFPYLEDSFQAPAEDILSDLTIFEDWIFPFTALDSMTLEHGLQDSSRHHQHMEQRNDPSLDRDICFTNDSPFLVTAPDLAKAKENIMLFDWQRRLQHFPIRSKYKAIGYIRAFFQYFAPHTPIVHAKTFRIATTPSPLLLAVLATGAIHADEWEAGVELHRAVLKLLAQHDELITAGEKSADFEIWELQTRLLCCQFGVFSGSKVLENQARTGFSTIIQLAQRSEAQILRGPGDTWHQWIAHQTSIRCVCWTVVLAAVLLSNDDRSTFVMPPLDATIPLPCLEELWCASEIEWRDAPKPATDSLGIIKSVLSGETPSISPTSFGLLTLMGAILGHICAFDTLSNCQFLTHHPIIMGNLEGTLRFWEDLWRAHPRCNSLPDTVHGPLMSDALSLLSSAYYHMYGHQQLKVMKAFMRNPDELGEMDLKMLFTCQRQQGLKSAVIRAAKSLLLRVRLGIKHLKKTAALQYACYSPISAYEGGLLLCWYLLGEALNSDPNDATHSTVSSLFDEIALEYEERDNNPLHRVLLPLVVYEELMSVEWVWRSTSSLADQLSRQRERITTAWG